MIHQPVLVKEVCSLLDLKPGKIIVDATVGSGGHSAAIAPLIQPGGRLIGLDRDNLAITRTRQRMDSDKIDLFCENFINLGNILGKLGLKGVDGIILDLGVSSEQLSDTGRGFSFQTTGPLDMRMDKCSELTAEKIINRYPLERLMSIFSDYGEERWSRRIARAIVKMRQNSPIRTTSGLAAVISQAVPGRGRIHPATRIFQALRIAVNQELDNLSSFLGQCETFLNPEGRLAIISFHSGEDRLVKTAFREKAIKRIFQIITRKPFYPSREEMSANPRSRSARLRVAEKSVS